MSMTTSKATEKAAGKVYDEALMEQVLAYMARAGLKQADLVQRIGKSSTTVSQYFGHKYPGDVKGFEDLLREFLRQEEEAGKSKAQLESYQLDESYKPTSLSEDMYQCIRYAQINRELVILHGDAGAGKTKTAGKYVRDNPQSTIYISLTPSMAGSAGVAEMLCERMGIPTMSNPKMWKAIRAKLRGTNKVILVDEAQLLKKNALEELRILPDADEIEDIPGNGVVLIGNSEIYQRVEKEEIKSQMYTRIGFHRPYSTAKLTNEDVRMLFPMFAGEDKKEELRLIGTICRSKNSIRTAKKVVKIAIRNGDISSNGLRAALAATGKGRL